MECYVDADFSGGWDKAGASNLEAVMSRTGYVIKYANCPVLWCSKLQTEIVISTTKAEYIALSQAMREVIPFMNLLEEINEVFPLNLKEPKFHCKVFEDNNSCIAIATGQKFSPRTKHIAIKYHHFQQYVREKLVTILPIDTKEQLSDIFTKLSDEVLFLYLRSELLDW